MIKFIQRIFGLTLKTLLILALLSVLAYVVRGQILKFVLIQYVQIRSGVKLEIKKCSWDINEFAITLQGVKFYNPEEYWDEVMMDIPDAYIVISWPDVLKDLSLHINFIKVHMKELVVIKGSNKVLNLHYLKLLRISRDEESGKLVEGKSQIPVIEKPRFDEVELKIDRVYYKDYTARKVSEKVYDVYLTEHLYTVPDFRTLIRVTIFKALTKTTIDKLTDIDLGRLEKILGGTLGSAPKLLQKAIVNTAEGTTQVIKKTADVIKNATKDVIPVKAGETK